MSNITKTLVKSAAAGACIALAALLYTRWYQEFPLIAAILFSLGLLLIVENKFNLFTGKIGYLNKPAEINNLLLILLGNCIGACILFIFPLEALRGQVVPLSLSNPALASASIICGALVHFAVTTKKRWLTAFCVVAFILVGGDHCIARFCYMVLSRNFTLGAWICFLASVLGSSLGAIFVNKILEFCNENNTNSGTKQE